MTAVNDLGLSIDQVHLQQPEKWLLRPGDAAKFLGLSRDGFSEIRDEIPYFMLPGSTMPRYSRDDLINFAMKYRVVTREYRVKDTKAAEIAKKILEDEKRKVKNIPSTRQIAINDFKKNSLSRK